MIEETLLHFATAANPLKKKDAETGKAQQWKNEAMLWSDFVEYLRKTIKRPPYTRAEFNRLSDKQKSRIKNVAGFVGGELGGSRERNLESLVARHFITLDADKVDSNIIGNIKTVLPDTACIIYSTISHTDEQNKLRIVIPLSEGIDAITYNFLARHVANELGMEQFDVVSFRAAQFMYVSTTLRKEPHVFKVVEGELFDVDDIELLYGDPETSIPPLLEKESPEHIMQGNSEKGDPAEKGGFIGAFCRTFSIADAIDTFLSDVYEPSGFDTSRYKFIGSNSMAGFQIFADGYCMSNHTQRDPAANGHTHNAFDIVRIHLFTEDWLKDENQNRAGATSKSFKAMTDFIYEERNGVCKEVYKEYKAHKKSKMKDAFQEAFEDSEYAKEMGLVLADKTKKKTGQGSENRFTEHEFTDYEEIPHNSENDDLSDLLGEEMLSVSTTEETDIEIADPDAWLETLEETKTGFKASVSNLSIILTNHPVLHGLFGFDLMRGRAVFHRRPPWRARTDFDVHGSKEVVNETNDIVGIKVFMQRDELTGNLSFGTEAIREALNDLRNVVPFHPIKDYLQLQKWDGTERLETLIIDHVGAYDDEDGLTRAMTRKMFIAACARAMEAGCTFHHAMILTGKQGAGKSSLLRRMSLGYIQDNIDLSSLKYGTQKVYENIKGAWFIEMAELAGLHRTNMDATKNLITQSSVKYSGKYQRDTNEQKMTCVFFGTTNDDTFLTDHDNRRFWVIEVGVNDVPEEKIPWRMSDELVGQLWAEAFHYYKNGESLTLEKEQEIAARDLANEYIADHPHQDLMDAILDMEIPENWYEMSTETKIAFMDGDFDSEEVEKPKTSPRKFITAKEIINIVDSKEGRGSVHPFAVREYLKGKIREKGLVKHFSEGKARKGLQKRFGKLGNVRDWYSISEKSEISENE